MASIIGDTPDTTVDFNADIMRQISLVLNGGGSEEEPSSPANPTVVEITSVTVSGNIVGPWTFDSGSFPVQNSEGLAGSTLEWIE